MATRLSNNPTRLSKHRDYSIVQRPKWSKEQRVYIEQTRSEDKHDRSEQASAKTDTRQYR